MEKLGTTAFLNESGDIVSPGDLPSEVDPNTIPSNEFIIAGLERGREHGVGTTIPEEWGISDGATLELTPNMQHASLCTQLAARVLPQVIEQPTLNTSIENHPSRSGALETQSDPLSEKAQAIRDTFLGGVEKSKKYKPSTHDHLRGPHFSAFMKDVALAQMRGQLTLQDIEVLNDIAGVNEPDSEHSEASGEDGFNRPHDWRERTISDPR